MEEQIKRIVKSQKVQYISFWIIPLLLVLIKLSCIDIIKEY